MKKALIKPHPPYVMVQVKIGSTKGTESAIQKFKAVIKKDFPLFKIIDIQTVEVQPQERPTFVDTKHQLEFLQEKVGLNISQLAVLLKVQRPAIYEWMKNYSPNRNNQERLDKLYFLFDDWKEEKKLRIGDFLYKVMNGKQSLYELLTKEKIDEDLCKKMITQIKNTVVANQRAALRRKDILEKAKFAPVSEEQMYANLNRMIRKA